MSTFIFWNKQNTGCDTYEELLTLERDGYSYSSCVTLDDPEEVVDCVLNETNADLGYHRYVPIKAKPLPNLTAPRTGQVECTGCIIGDKVYKAVEPVDENDCTGCCFNTGGGLSQHCCKLKCSPVYRDDKRDVIWMEHTDHYTGHEVT
tara:strand:+ start:2574 stop:3017 length:444 start_codon:yes stop_codon:yes gene_type:complete